MVFSLMPHDLDRSVLSVRIGQKPYFELVDGRLELRGVPVEPSAEAYFANHPPRIRSYLWAMLVHSRALPGPVGTFLRGDVATLARKREINCAILASAALELQHRELDFVFLVFHPEVELRAASWRTIWLTETLDALEVPHLSSMDLIHARRPDTPLSELIEESNGHPTTLYNTVIANAIAEWVLAAQVRGECP